MSSNECGCSCGEMIAKTSVQPSSCGCDDVHISTADERAELERLRSGIDERLAQLES